MVTRTKSRNSNRSSTSSTIGGRKEPPGSGNGRRDSAFAWGRNGGGALVGATLAGVAIGLAANFGRKFLMQSVSGSAGDWDQVLAAEHDAAMAIFDKMLATDATQGFKRGVLLMKLTTALDKHAHEEEMVVYPALREANEAHDADLLEGEHGHVKTFIYELNQMGTDVPNWLEKVREFKALVAKHAQMEEQQVFPRFKQDMSKEQNAKITSLVNRDGFWMS
jgi:hemerythrin superfamily protein